VAAEVAEVVAAAEIVADVPEATAVMVAPAGIPARVMVRPTSEAVKVPAAPVIVVLLAVVTVTVRPSVVRPVAMSQIS
jgi:hypothetical protein